MVASGSDSGVGSADSDDTDHADDTDDRSLASRMRRTVGHARSRSAIDALSGEARRIVAVAIAVAVAVAGAVAGAGAVAVGEAIVGEAEDDDLPPGRLKAQRSDRPSPTSQMASSPAAKSA